MAVATATCTCKECGKIFKSTKKLYNRAQADEWREWAENHFDLCPDCYREMKRAEEIALANEITAKYNLPQIDPTTGTEKQIAYATSLRNKWLIEHEDTVKKFAEVKSMLVNATDAELAKYAAVHGTTADTDAIWAAVTAKYYDKISPIAIYSTNAKEIIDTIGY